MTADNGVMPCTQVDMTPLWHTNLSVVRFLVNRVTQQLAVYENFVFVHAEVGPQERSADLRCVNA